MTVLYLLRHGRTAANVAQILPGRRPGIELDAVGIQQAQAAAARLRATKLTAVVTSPLARCRQTVAALTDAPEPVVDERLIEADFGEWTGRSVPDLAREPLWEQVQRTPSTVTFPGGESITAMQARAMAAIRDWDARVTAEHGAEAAWLVCSHADVIKTILAALLGVPLDNFQRFVVANAAPSVVHLAADHAYLLQLNAFHESATTVPAVEEQASTAAHTLE